jgi:two-component system, sensor histidine kinase and response regulator
LDGRERAGTHAVRPENARARLTSDFHDRTRGLAAVPTDRFSHVLIVEDDPAELTLLCGILEEEGFHVIGCDSGGDALEHARRRDFDVAVVDHRLPDLSGTQLLQQIRSFDDQIRVIIYTGVASYDSVKEALNHGAFAYLEKLSDRSELLRYVHRACLERVDRYAADLEQAAALRIEELARSNRDLEAFASVAAHDLRSPLLTISGYCQLIHNEYGDRLDATALGYLAQIVAGAGRMDRLIEGILEYSRAGRCVAPLRQVDMQAVLVQAMANLEGSIREHDAQIEVGPMPTVVGDRTQLVQLLQNLLGNAMKFRRDEPPRIRVSSSASQRGWRFAVEDNGIGIAEEHFEQIFRTFQRLCGPEYPGAGIGLSVCRKIVERHRGRIWLASTVGQGTTFYFTIADQPPELETTD